MPEIEIRSLLKVGKGRKFIPIEDYEETIRAVFIEGAIVIRVGGRTLLDQRQWDFIDQLWGYISDGVTQVSLGNDFKTYFPDDPAWIAFAPDRKTRTVKLSVYAGTLEEARLPIDAMISAFSTAAVVFFEWLVARFPEHDGRADWYRPSLEAMRSLADRSPRRSK